MEYLLINKSLGLKLNLSMKLNELIRRKRAECIKRVFPQKIVIKYSDRRRRQSL